MPYPLQCALCGVVWHRETPDRVPPLTAPHDHTQADWDSYISANGLDPQIYTSTPIWLKIAGVEYPPLPNWPPELGAPPPGYPPLVNPPPSGKAVIMEKRPVPELDELGHLRRRPRAGDQQPAFRGPSTATPATPAPSAEPPSAKKKK